MDKRKDQVGEGPSMNPGLDARPHLGVREEVGLLGHRNL